MPKSKLEKAVFGAMMALAMVYGMEVYNFALRNSVYSSAALRVSLNEMVGLSAIVFVLQEFVGGPLARTLAWRCVDPRTAPPMLLTLTLTVFTVFCMCPLMSLVTTSIFLGTGEGLLHRWLNAVRINLPMAFAWQLLVAGPLVRLSFRTLFARTAQR